MEDSITQFRNTVARFCLHLESSSGALLQSVNRRPIPFGSEIDEQEEDMNDSLPNTSLDSKNTMEDDSLFDDTLSLQKLGISDASLATLQSEGNMIEVDPLYERVMDIEEVEKDGHSELKPFEGLKSFIDVTKYVYEGLPSYMKCLVSWEDLLAAVEKMNLHLKQKTKNDHFFTHDEVSSLNLGEHNIFFLVQIKRFSYKSK
ncbi:hypothetical protein R6Q57_010485 [Mikania cordata]